MVSWECIAWGLFLWSPNLINRVFWEIQFEEPSNIIIYLFIYLIMNYRTNLFFTIIRYLLEFMYLFINELYLNLVR